MHESNAYPGVAVKFLSGKVNTVLVGFEDAKKRLPKAKRVVVSGTPTKLKKLNLYFYWSEVEKDINILENTIYVANW